MKITTIQFLQAKKLAEELPVIEDRLRRAGLYVTAVALNAAVKRIGYEIAEKAPKD